MPAKMTPGPWTVCKGWSNEFTKRVPIKVGSAPTITIAETLGAPKGDMADANARAIACLPELVEAARAIMTSPADSISANGKAIAAFQALRRILARIEGGENV